MLNTLFTLQELCYFWIKKGLFLWFFFLFFLFFEGIHALWIRNFCWLHWLNVEITDFCKDESWLTLLANSHLEGSIGVFFLFLFFFFAHQCAFHLFQIHHNTNGRFRSFLLVCFHLDQIVLTDRKRYVPLFPSLNSYCHFLDLIFSWAVKKA